MSGRIFISHAGDDSAVARRVADVLSAERLEPVLDRQTLIAGDSFLSFMEEALETSDYCLLLWSAAAATRPWVRVEWESALERSVSESRAFLAVGRLDAHALPMLLRPRLYVTLHPDLQPGLGELVTTWREDRGAESLSDRLVGSAAGAPSGPPAPGLEQVYITSELFGITIPWQVDPQAPAGVLLDEVRRRLALPESLDKDGRVGVRLAYCLGLDDRPLDRARSLVSQGVARGSVLWIEVELSVFAATKPVDGTLASARFRSGTATDPLDAARTELVGRLDAAGLGVRSPRRRGGVT